MYAFYILVLIGVVLLWFLLSFAFKSVGRLGYKVWKDAKDAMTEVDEDTNINKK